MLFFSGGSPGAGLEPRLGAPGAPSASALGALGGGVGLLRNERGGPLCVLFSLFFLFLPLVGFNPFIISIVIVCYYDSRVHGLEDLGRPTPGEGSVSTSFLARPFLRVPLWWFKGDATWVFLSGCLTPRALKRDPGFAEFRGLSVLQRSPGI